MKAAIATLVDAPPPLEAARLRLIVLGGRVASYPLSDRGSITLGRDPNCDVVIEDPHVSRVHARLACDRLTIEDLGSSMGTWLRGTRLAPGQVETLRYDEVFQLGSIAVVLQRAVVEAPVAATAIAPGERVVCVSPAMHQLYATIDRVAVGTISIMILGETGVGKEILAEAIHRRSQRASAPLLRLNCAALSETLLESELFGHEKGAFTGAVQSKPGLLESADGGTVLLDEVAELPLATQVKLLRVLESREVMRVGALRPRPIDVRFVSATHRDLDEWIDRGAFREDLYFRLNGISLDVPALRDRLAEIAPLALHFAAAHSRSLHRPTPMITAEALAKLEAHTWPGNIRELRNCIERAVLLCETHHIDAHHIMIETRRARRLTPPPIIEDSGAPSIPDLRRRAVAVEREQIIAALARAAGNQKVAAQLLQISRRTLVNKLNALGIERPRKGR